MPNDPRPQLLYLARRRRGMSRQQFADRWRAHGALAMAQPRFANVAEYVHADRVPEIDGSRADDFDGVGKLVFRSREHLRTRNQAVDSQRIMELDEFETFDRPVRETHLFVEPRATAGSAVGTVPGDLKLFCFVWPPPELPADDFMARWANDEEERLTSALRHAATGTVSTPVVDEDTGAPGLDCAIVEEYSCLDVDALRRTQEAIVGRTAPDAHIGRLVAIATRDVVLLRRDRVGDGASRQDD